MAHPYWPLFDLRVRTPRLELRLPTDDDLDALAELGAKGIQDPDQPALGEWADLPPLERARSIVQVNWRARGTWTPEDWGCNPVVVVDGVIVGTQGVAASKFALHRVVRTGSWLGIEHQGKGLGKEMRAAVLHFAFAGLGARRATSGYWHDNERSSRISARLGYVANGESFGTRRGESVRHLDVRVDRDAWEPRRRDDIVIEGLEPCLELFGAVAP